MESGVYLKILAKVLQVLGLLFSSAAILGQKRIKKIDILGRKFRKIIQLRLFLRVIKSFISMTLLILLGVLFIIIYPIYFLPELFSTAPAEAGEALKYVMLVPFTFSLILYLGMTYIAISSISTSSKMNIFANSLIAFLNENWLETLWWKKFCRSWIYKLFYYLLFLLFYITIIAPLRTMHLILEARNIKTVANNLLEHYEKSFLPSGMGQIRSSRIKVIQESVSWKRYLQLFPFFHSKWLVYNPLNLIFYLYFVIMILYLWFGYYFMLAESFLSAIVFSIYFIALYLILWCLVNGIAVLVSAVLYFLAAPYKLFELLRVKARLRSSLLTLGLLLGLVGILID